MQAHNLFPVPKDRAYSRTLSGKRTRREDVSASLLSALSPGALPTGQMNVNGISGLALVDSGCSRSIAHMLLCPGWNKRQISMRTVSGEDYRCDETGPIRVSCGESASADLDVLVVIKKPLRLDVVLGMDGIEALGGVTLKFNRRTVWMRSDVMSLRHQYQRGT